jgi:hypothetical protein
VDAVNNSNNVSGSAADQFLQPWQACFVKTASNGVASITFTEASKGSGLTSVFQTAPPLSTLKIQLFQSDSFLAGTLPNDGLIIHFDSNYSETVDDFDAMKPTNQDENLAVSQQSQLLSIECRSIPKTGDTTALIFNQIRDISYLFQFNFVRKAPFKTYFVDRYTGLKSKLNDSGITETTVQFDKNIPGSIANNRFYLTYEMEEKTNAVNNEVELNSLVIQPNPTANKSFEVHKSTAFNRNDKLILLDASGKTIHQFTISENNNILKLTIPHQLSAGMYWLQYNDVKTGIFTHILFVD